MALRFPIAAAITMLLLAGCAARSTTGEALVRLETTPLDADCVVTGNGFTTSIKTPADVSIPQTASPLIVSCSAIGYKGSRALDVVHGPWSRATIGTSGLGELLGRGGSGNLPESFLVTMEYTEAGDPKEYEREKMADAKMEEAMAGKTSEALPAPPKMADAGLPPPPAAMPAMPVTKEAEKDAMPAGEKMAAKPMAKEAMPMMAATTEAARVHLASYKVKAHADRSWRRLLKANGKLLSGLKPSIEQVDLGAKGVFYRVYAGPLKDLKAARDLCVDLKRRRTYCRSVAKDGK